MNYEEALNWLSGYQFHGIKPGLERIRDLLARLGHPERNFRSVHIAGTNGKGSTAAILESVLRAHDVKTGLYTSPHLISVCERFVVAGRQISPARFADLCSRVRQAIGDDPVTYFELTTALAFLYFAEEGVEIAVVECGLGGRLDATNVIVPEVAVITNVGLDHQAYLGETIPEIAAEKAGIIKPQKPVVVGPLPEEAFEVVARRAEELSAPLWRYGSDFRVFPCRGGLFYQGKHQLPRLTLRLAGKFQRTNLALALKAFEILEEARLVSFDETRVREALKIVSWPGRYEKFKLKGLVILDGAHNLEGVEALLQTLHEEGIERYRLLFAASNEGGTKPYLPMLRRLLPRAEKTYLCPPPGPREPVTYEDWKEHLAKGEIPPEDVRLFKDWREALEEALEDTGPPLLVTGSLYLVGRVREVLLRKLGERRGKCVVSWSS